MDGTNGNPQGVLQTNTPITLSPGVDYYLSFDLIGSQRGTTASTTVTFGPYSQTFVLSSSDVTDGIVTNELVTVSSTTVTNLTFTSNTPGDVGDLLDNVLITTSPASSAVPEPSSIILIGSALLGLVLLARRVTKKLCFMVRSETRRGVQWELSGARSSVPPWASAHGDGGHPKMAS